MRAVVQRVTEAHVDVDGERVGAVAPGKMGLMILLGAGQGDELKDVTYLANKIAGLRVFEDSEGRMNLSLVDVGGSALVVSQFTLSADGRKGRRPSFDRAAPPELAEPLYERFVERLRSAGMACETGRFGARMAVELVNDGPVTFVLDEEP